MKINRIGGSVVILVLLALATAWPAPGQAPGSVHGWWEGAGNIVPWNRPQKAAVDHVKEILKDIMAETRDRWTINWDGESGFPRNLIGRSAQAYTGTPVEAAEQFIKKYRPIFVEGGQIDGSSYIKFIPVASTRDPLVVSFKTLYQGIPMLSGGPVLRFDKDMHVIDVGNGIAYPDNTELPAAQSPEAALTSLLSFLKPDSGVVVGDTHLLVYPSAPPRVAYRCTVNVYVKIGSRYQHNAFENEFIVDASTGEVLSVQSSLMSEFPLFPLSEDTTEYFGPFERLGRNTPMHEGRIPIIEMPPRGADSLAPPPRGSDSALPKSPDPGEPNDERGTCAPEIDSPHRPLVFQSYSSPCAMDITGVGRLVLRSIAAGSFRYHKKPAAPHELRRSERGRRVSLQSSPWGRGACLRRKEASEM